MVKWFVLCILAILIVIPRNLFAGTARHSSLSYTVLIIELNTSEDDLSDDLTDSIRFGRPLPKQNRLDVVKKIKEIAKTTNQAKPEKIEAPADTTNKAKAKPQRQRRPEGLERPPEIPRRNGD